MSDIVTRLRGEVAWEPDVGELMALAADEIERLRADWPDQLTASSVLIAEQEREIARLCQVLSQKNLTLTSEEREAVEYVELLLKCESHPVCSRHVDTLRSMLSRLG